MGWPLIVALAVGIPVVIFVPLLVWVAVASGLYQVVRDRARRRALASQRRVVGVAEAPVLRKVEEAIGMGDIIIDESCY